MAMRTITLSAGVHNMWLWYPNSMLHMNILLYTTIFGLLACCYFSAKTMTGLSLHICQTVCLAVAYRTMILTQRVLS